MDKSKLFAYTYAALGATVPFASLMTFSILIKPIYVMRYVLPSLPFFLLLLAAGLCELPLLIMTTGFALLLTANVFGTVEYYRVPTKPDRRILIISVPSIGRFPPRLPQIIRGSG